MTKIINLFGACGSGKSTLAAGLFYQMKLEGFNVELAGEWIKNKVFEDTKYPFSDQLYTFAKQQKLLRQMIGKTDYIITDSPLPLSVVYQSEEPEMFSDLVMEYFKRYDNLNYFLERGHEYQQSGRVHTEKQSEEIAEKVKAVLEKYDVPYQCFKTGASENIVQTILTDLYYMERTWEKK